MESKTDIARLVIDCILHSTAAYKRLLSQYFKIILLLVMIFRFSFYLSLFISLFHEIDDGTDSEIGIVPGSNLVVILRRCGKLFQMLKTQATLVRHVHSVHCTIRRSTTYL